MQCTCTIEHDQRGKLRWYYKTACPIRPEDHAVWDNKFAKVFNAGFGFGRVEGGDFIMINDGTVCTEPPTILHSLGQLC